MALTKAERARVAEIRRGTNLKPDDRGYLEALKRFATPGGPDRLAIDDAIHHDARKLEDGSDAPEFGAGGLAEARRRGWLNEPDVDDTDRQASEFWTEFEKQRG